jgi:hypothetical protein
VRDSPRMSDGFKVLDTVYEIVKGKMVARRPAERVASND